MPMTTISYVNDDGIPVSYIKDLDYSKISLLLGRFDELAELTESDSEEQASMQYDEYEEDWTDYDEDED